ncbi:MAG: 4-(cytidine 5'-diphospho)-2-C-methyl-D-erythritol kinase [Bacteroidales bacterium]|nr:4-(cytidine 5'-diphospho)-2-C-methyl-D-erythritol kinase [Bacteroidales bacterium]
MITNPNVKINLGLNVLRKREDGFHDLETLFVPYFGISDTLEIVVGDDYSRTSAALFSKYGSSSDVGHGSAVPERFFGVEVEESVAPKLVQGISEDGRLMITIARAEGVDWDPLKDLTARAYYLLSEDHQLPPVKIFLEKTSPVGAGLGGGSADAAFALKMLNDICALGLSEHQLADYAARLGSDCAFFIYNRSMIGEGRGEILSEYPIDLSAYDLQVLAPEGISVSTKDAYGGIRPHLPEVPLREALTRPIEQWDGTLVNDFEETVFAKHLELAAIKRSLYDSGAVYASMSGSGSALFALYRK